MNYYQEIRNVYLSRMKALGGERHEQAILKLFELVSAVFNKPNLDELTKPEFEGAIRLCNSVLNAIERVKGNADQDQRQGSGAGTDGGDQAG
ncbi:hypothetical protein [Gorillibacterium sp. sgz5001074]|uniref:hypothetical protein n=1 Tax=Gorillibacterium sp. sgz5001074 TaxID=3446695 RepID=UPI003F6641C4